MKWIEDLVFRYEFTRQVRKQIVGLTWRKAWGYYVLKGDHEDPIDAARAAVRKLRRRP